MSPLRPPREPYRQGGVLTTAMGRIVGSGGALVGPSLTLISIQETEDNNGPWTVTLAAIKASSGIPPAGPAPAGFPLDNLILTAVLAQSIQLQWGAGGANEQVTLDYPAMGGTFTVHAGSLSLQTLDRQAIVLPAPPNILPQVAAWATPGARACTWQPKTTTLVAAAANAATFVPVPRRAVGYLLTAATGDDLRTMGTLVQQLDMATNTPVSIDRTVAGGFVWSAATPAQLWTPITPVTTALQLGATGLGLGLDRNVRVIFALDLG